MLRRGKTVSQPAACRAAVLQRVVPSPREKPSTLSAVNGHPVGPGPYAEHVWFFGPSPAAWYAVSARLKSIRAWCRRLPEAGGLKRSLYATRALPARPIFVRISTRIPSDSGADSRRRRRRHRDRVPAVPVPSSRRCFGDSSERRAGFDRRARNRRANRSFFFFFFFVFSQTIYHLRTPLRRTDYCRTSRKNARVRKPESEEYAISLS